MCPLIAADAAPATPGSGILTQNVKFVRQSLGKFGPVQGDPSWMRLRDVDVDVRWGRSLHTHVLVMRVQRYRLPQCCF